MYFVDLVDADFTILTKPNWSIWVDVWNDSCSLFSLNVERLDYIY